MFLIIECPETHAVMLGANVCQKLETYVQCDAGVLRANPKNPTAIS